MAAVTGRSLLPQLLLLPALLSIALAYRPGDIVPMSRMGQYHSVSVPQSSFSIRMCLWLFYSNFVLIWMLLIFEIVHCSHELCGTTWLAVIVPFSQSIVRCISLNLSTRVSYANLHFFFIHSLCGHWNSNLVLPGDLIVGVDAYSKANWLHWRWSV